MFLNVLYYNKQHEDTMKKIAKKPETEVVSFRIPKEIMMKVRVLGKKLDRDYTWMINDLLKKALKVKK